MCIKWDTLALFIDQILILTITILKSLDDLSLSHLPSHTSFPAGQV